MEGITPITPWDRLRAVVELRYVAGDGARITVCLERMPHVWSARESFNLADRVAEEALNDSTSKCAFVHGSTYGSHTVNAGAPLPSSGAFSDLRRSRVAGIAKNACPEHLDCPEASSVERGANDHHIRDSSRSDLAPRSTERASTSSR
jgi:hypothetical protein